MALNGGKSYLASKIISLMPPRKDDDHPDGYVSYVEPYAGGLSVLLANNPEGISEVINDLNRQLTNLWEVLQRETPFAEFQRIIEATPFSEARWQEAMDYQGWDCDTPACVRCACEFFIYCRQSLAGRMTSFAPLSKTRVRRGMNEQASAWLTCIDGLPEVHTRLKRVVILGPRLALEVIKQQDGPQTLFYLDPPYLHETRATTKEYGEHEMSYSQHAELLGKLRCLDGKFLLSGYRSELYDSYALANHWNRHDFDLPNNAASGTNKRRMTECIWTNY